MTYACCDHCTMTAPHPGHERPCSATCRGATKLPSKAPSIPVETTEADECAHTALSLIYRRERDEARDEVEQLHCIAADALVRENDWRGSYLELLDMLNTARVELDIAKAMIATDDTELQAKDAMIAERDASIARLTIRLAEDDRDATIERMTAYVEDFRAAHRTLEGVIDKRNITIERLNAEATKTGALVADLQTGLSDAITEVARLEKVIIERDATIERLTYDRNHPYGEVALGTCPDSCGGQSWTRVGTSRGGRWRCDTCGRIVSRYVSDAIQAADDRRAL